MKKLIYLSIIFLALQSCSSEGESNDNLLFMDQYDGFAWKCKTEDKYLWINNTISPAVYYGATIGLYYYTPATNFSCYNEEKVWNTPTADFKITAVISQQSLVLQYYKFTTLSTFSWKIDGLAKTRTITVKNNILKEEIEYFENNISTKKEVLYFDSLGKGSVIRNNAIHSICRF